MFVVQSFHDLLSSRWDLAVLVVTVRRFCKVNNGMGSILDGLEMLWTKLNLIGIFSNNKYGSIFEFFILQNLQHLVASFMLVIITTTLAFIDFCKQVGYEQREVSK